MRTSTIPAICTFAILATIAACIGDVGPGTPSETVPGATGEPLAAPSSATVVPEARHGVLRAGSYRYSQREPAATFTVPKGWVMTESLPLHFGLRPPGFHEDNSIRTWYDMRVASRDPSCPEHPDTAFGHTADAMIEAFSTRPGIAATDPASIALGGLEGQWIDVRIDPGWIESCPFTDGLAATTLFVDDVDPNDPAFWGLGGYDERMRLIVLDDGAGSSVIVTIDAIDEPTFEDLLVAAKPVIDTFRFEVGRTSLSPARTVDVGH